MFLSKKGSCITLLLLVLCLLLSSGIVLGARKVTLKLWVLPWVDNFGAGIDELLTEFKAEHKNIDVIVEEIPWNGCLEKYKAAVMGGTAPDIAASTPNRFPPLAELDLIEPLDKYMTSDFKNQFLNQDVLEMGKFNNHYYALPALMEPRVLFYNKDLFEAAGIRETPKTWEEFFEVGKKIRQKTGKYGYAFPGMQRSFLRFTFWLNQAGGSVFNADGTKCVINDQYGVEALSFLVKLMDEGIMPKGSVGMTEEEVEALFSSGETAMMINGPNFLPILDKITGLNYGVADIFQGRTSITSGGPELYFMFNTSKNKPEAWELLKYLVSDTEFVSRRCEKFVYFPVIKGTSIEWKDTRMEYFENAVETGVRDVASHPKMDEVTPILAGAIQGALMGELTPQEAFDQAAEQINARLSR